MPEFPISPMRGKYRVNRGNREGETRAGHGH
jgi:hypothetical protein